MSDSEDRTDGAVRDFLLKEYEHIAESFWKSEGAGETRVNWFIGIVGAVTAALVSLVAGEHALDEPGHVQMLMIVGGFGLLVYGVLTLFRLRARDVRTDECKDALSLIRNIFKKHFDGAGVLTDYHPFGTKRGGRTFGGLRDSVAIINGLIVAGIVLVALLPFQSGVSLRWGRVCVPLFCAGASGILAAWGCMRLTRRDRPPSHAGGVVFREAPGGREYLLVGPSRGGENEWLLPKGHIEPGEVPHETAVREVQEEAGVDAHVVDLVDSAEFQANGEHVRSRYYLMRSDPTSTAPEKRAHGWFTFQDARAKLTHEAAKALLEKAEKIRLGRR